MTTRGTSPKDTGRRASRRYVATAALLLPAITLAGCSSTGGRTEAQGGGDGGGQVAQTESMKVAMITHAVPGDTFWDRIRAGAEEASAKDNVEFLYASDPEGGRQAQLVQQYIDQGVDGIAVTLAKPDALRDVLQNAEEAGIPVVSFNAGEQKFEELGAFAHFGSDEQLAGETAGARLKEEGIEHPICVIQEQGHVGLEARCAGVKEALPQTEILYVQGTDMTQVASTATAKLQSSAEADAIVGLAAPTTMTLLGAKADAGSDVAVASFDMNGDLAQAVVDGDVMFTIDQQPWLQGYLSVDSLWQNQRGAFKIGGGQPVLTGPAVVDSSNAEEVLQYANEGIR
ncbi:substrate-binding domain-containing protein [Kocuria sp. SM24M-10]|uniref:substrate-binding domain-containing protein n=1 Tax=Kocuria sp. SM24M-10 TaxID=1660349 RepID=UPI0009E5EBD7|nr:substrate-binding domain-containing protein [Kocuria sp. SM24M-10]